MAKLKYTRDEALTFHLEPTPGKFEIQATVPMNTQRDLSLAYSPGVAIPCEEIAANPETAYDYTNKGNLVAVISNGTAVLGLGNIGAAARAMKVMGLSDLVLVAPERYPDEQATARASGADDVLAYGFCPAELALRLRRQAAAKCREDKLRENMHEGLRAAATDPLTGLYNRRFALPHLARLTASSTRENSGCAVMVIDVDHFKKVNDSFGHEAGDTALVTLAGLFNRSLRNGDMASRIGGEEFLIVLPNTTAQEAQHAARRLCEAVSNHKFKLPGSPRAQHLTVSIGVAVTGAKSLPCSKGNQAAEALLRDADLALYGSKNHGRNQVTLSPRSAA